MGHLLPSAGVLGSRGDQFLFHRVFENTTCDNTYDDIPTNIFDYKWTDYREEDAASREERLEFAHYQQQPNEPSQTFRHAPSPRGIDAESELENGGTSGNYRDRSNQLTNAGLAGCPPMGVNHGSLIRPLDKSLHSSTRPTGKPYFTQESMPSCLPHQASLARKGGFNYRDWLSTQSSRLQPSNLRGSCLPSLATWCQPVYVDCCPDYGNPWAYSFSKKTIPYYY